MEIAKIVHVVASSEKSFEDAVQRGVTNAAKSLRGISGLKVTDWTATIRNDKVSHYKVTMDIAFAVEET